ncbi:WhiB family transcriptional regulator [Pseudonocardia sp. SID8383]|uniref:WhiB family transcriptional regulator n=1 Tax=Pseudonocardia sp. SID8383 TaxID=2690363 RepID=UPI001370F11F|nr:WhiB family transcriptional regulator [Pseudonocardia sp. SID8383]MYW73600.1 WhiB family transcriptional regulator [Pseudonocardia sp. SID8383]
MSEVLCENDPDGMFPVAESTRPGLRTGGERAALAVCAACPVMASCRLAVLNMEMPYGVAGGMTAADRRAIRAADRRPAATVAA